MQHGYDPRQKSNEEKTSKNEARQIKHFSKIFALPELDVNP
jgi:hypothetical protein